MPPRVTKDDVKAEIKKLIGDANFASLVRDEGAYLEDFAALGELMADEARCRKHLATLNGRITKKLLADEVVRSQLFKPSLSDRIAGRKEDMKALESLNLKGNKYGEVKHFGLLSGFFSGWEATWGFNSVQGSLPAKAPTLTRFVDPKSFKTYLFSPGFHWKDPGVGENHGEFTHRIQWYIALQEQIETPFLRKTPLQVFQFFADDRCSGKEGLDAKTIWDKVFDRGRGDFRSPETLHAWLKDPQQASDTQFSVLAQLVAGRALKRAREYKTFKDPKTGPDLDFYGRKLEKTKAPLLAAEGPIDRKTGQKFETIVWKDTSSSYHKVKWTDDEIRPDLA